MRGHVTAPWQGVYYAKDSAEWKCRPTCEAMYKRQEDATGVCFAAMLVRVGVTRANVQGEWRCEKLWVRTDGSR